MTDHGGGRVKKILLVLILLLSTALLITGCEDGGSWMSSSVESATNTRAAEDLNAESATILVYMIASDLESEAGCATTDIEEMCDASLSENTNVVIQTGGTTYWANDIMDKKKVQRFEILEGGLKKVADVGRCKNVSMADPKTMSDFIAWGMKNYPADRYGVILWDHGGGSIMGFGLDEYHPDDLLSIDEIGQAFETAGAKVDFIGFDACLMGTIETAYALSDYADYMIASEETEPGQGWHYTNWLTELSENPGVNMKDLSRTMINDFVEGEDVSFWDDVTLALYDLKDAKQTYQSLCAYLEKSRNVLMNHGFSQMADARLDVRSYGDDEYEQIDIRSYMDKAQIEDEELKADLEHMIVYYSGNIEDSTGLAMYYPYSYLEYYSDMMQLMDRIGMTDENYRGYFNDFVSTLAKGSSSDRSAAASRSPVEQLTGNRTEEEETDYSGESWYDEAAADAGYDGSAQFSTEEDLIFTEKGDELILDLTDEQWKSIGKVEMELYLKDEDGYLYLGRDSMVDYNKNGDLIAGFDYLWVAINDQIVPFYIISDTEDGDKWQAVGYVPAVLNEGKKKERDINIYIRWDSDHENGYVMGYTAYKDEEDSLSLARKNYLQFKKGDTLDFYCDCYTDDCEYDDVYFVGDTLKVGKDGLNVSYQDLDEDEEVMIGYRLVDKYRNEYWTELLVSD